MVHSYDIQLATLARMGFSDHDANVAALQQAGGVVTRAIEVLVAGGSAANNTVSSPSTVVGTSTRSTRHFPQLQPAQRDKVVRLAAMGFSDEGKVRHALVRSGWDVDRACAMLVDHANELDSAFSALPSSSATSNKTPASDTSLIDWDDTNVPANTQPAPLLGGSTVGGSTSSLAAAIDQQQAQQRILQEQLMQLRALQDPNHQQQQQLLFLQQQLQQQQQQQPQMMSMMQPQIGMQGSGDALVAYQPQQQQLLQQQQQQQLIQQQILQQQMQQQQLLQQQQQSGMAQQGIQQPFFYQQQQQQQQQPQAMFMQQQAQQQQQQQQQPLAITAGNNMSFGQQQPQQQQQPSQFGMQFSNAGINNNARFDPNVQSQHNPFLT